MGEMGKTIIECNFSIDENYGIVMGDEHFFRIMEEKALDRFDKLLYKDDLDNFKQFLVKDVHNYSVVVRIKDKDDEYRWYIIYNQGNILSKTGLKIYNLQMQDIVVISNRFDLYLKRVTKYRSILNIIDEKVFEYDYKSGMITIYYYRNDKSEIIEKEYLEEWKQLVINKGYIDNTQRDYFELLCKNMKYGSEKFQVTLRTSLMSHGEREDLLTFIGETITSGAERVITVGIIKEHNNRMNTITNVMYNVAEFDKDAATGLLNKKATAKEMQNMIESAKEEQDKTLYLAILDIDDFKNVNDTYGHLFGDEVIAKFAASIKDFAEGRGIAGRIGGDEFAIMLEDIHNAEEVRTLLDTLRMRVKKQFADENTGYEFSTSIGVAKYPDDEMDYEKLFKLADSALYIAKEKGKDICVVYNKELYGDVMNMTINQIKSNYKITKMKPVDRAILMCDTIDNLRACESSNEVDTVVKYFLREASIDGISIFKGSNMECVKTFGEYNVQPEPADYVRSKSYSRYFDMNDTNKMSNIMTLVVDYPEAYSDLRRNNICSFLQLKFISNDEQEVIVQCDIFGNIGHKWSDEEVGLMYVVARELANVV